MYKKYIGGIIGISLLAIISIIVVYSFNYSIAWQKDIDHNATSSFVDMLSLIITPAVTLISVILYYFSLKEQQHQNKLIMEQQFDDKWQSLLNNHMKIRDEQQIKFEILKWTKEQKILLNGHFCFIALIERYARLKDAIELNIDFGDLCQVVAYWEEYCEQNSNDWVVMEQNDPIGYEREIEIIRQKNQVDYVGSLFNIKKEMNHGDSSKKAFGLLYDKYLSRSSIYLTHFCSLLKFLQRHENIYSDKINECVDSLMAILTESEKSIILLYADYDTKNGELIKKYIKS